MSPTTSPDSFRNALAQFLTPQVWKQAYQAYRPRSTAPRWSLQPLVWVLLTMTWCLGQSQEERFAAARAVYVAHHQRSRRPGTTLAGFLAASGTTFVAAQDGSPFGAGWTLSSVNQLVAIGADSTGPAGELMIFGNGGDRFFAQGASTATFNSPAGDNGALMFNGMNYTYTTPAGEVTTFNSSGYETQWSSADGKERRKGVRLGF
jgi:hypothetical protein